ncbi:Rad52/Rad22 family DNA repair protein, partial [Streptomyces bohaiensis]
MTTTDTPTLTDRQRERLLRPLNPARTQRNPAGFRYLEAWDVRRYLTRIFGFGGYSTDLLSLDLAHAAEVTPRRWVVVYRAAVKLTVYVDGREFGHWHGVATGAGRNLPVADAHDIAAKAADSGALKRAATNLGDQFGLSLYDGGSLDPVVLGTLVKSTTAPPEADTQVKPDPEETHPDEATTVPTTP